MSSGWGETVFQVGDTVVFVFDGARGIVLNVKDGLCHVLWEDEFVSWEKPELLRLIDAAPQNRPET
ncbi:MAG TPA: hypothetical protein VIK75_09950 [Calditerricola sp.]